MSANELEVLRQENAALRLRLAALEAQLAFLGNHRTLAAGLTGEVLISQHVDGTTTAYAAGHDVRSANGQTIEVKKSRLTEPAKGYASRRWQWQKVFGQSGGKQYDYLLLVGDVDERFRQHYRNDGAPFVFFAIPFSDVGPLTTSGVSGSRAIMLSSNPTGLRSEASRRMFDSYQVSPSDLTQRFGLRVD